MAKQQGVIHIPEGSKPVQVSIGPGFKAKISEQYLPKDAYIPPESRNPIIWLNDKISKEVPDGD